ncbi:hypothetical protein F5Y16DRAFT_258921 [Xylariaceae sp. FL0255]|nr:hypothetical protein F5Y16DRAFT_258921 [Xylariaceae sp. FL0255]
MVSQPDYNHSSLALRGPSSVVSARTSSHRQQTHASSRSRRYNRSHTGGTSYVPQNEFPVFSQSGNVEIVITTGGQENRYLLHRITLTRCSGFFEASTSQQWSKAQILPPANNSLPEPVNGNGTKELTRIGEETGSNSGSGSDVGGRHRPSPLEEGRRRWRYELDWGSDADDIPMLVQKETAAPNLNFRNKDSSTFPTTQSTSLFGGPTNASTANISSRSKHSHTHSTNSFFRSVANLSLVPHKSSDHRSNSISNGNGDAVTSLSQADTDLLRDYDNLFRIFYNYPPVLDGVNIADAYVQCKSLLTLADQYDALAVVGPRVDHHLLQFQSRLWKQIAKYPVSYLRLGYLSRSKVIFQEALIHVVGQWPAGERSIRTSFPETVLDIIEDKVDELEEIVSRIEGRLFRLNLTNSRGERITPQTGYLEWLAVSLWRQWLADHTNPTPQPPQAPPRAASSSRHTHHINGNGSRSSRDGTRPSAAPAVTAVVATVTPIPTLAAIGRTYRILGSANGSAYLGHDECKRFLKLTPELYSRDNLRRFEKRIDELKSAAREIVRPLMGTGLELELDRGDGVGGGRAAAGGGAVTQQVTGMMSYLTCVKVLERDLPWDVGD